MGVKELLTVQIDESGDAAASYYCRLPGASQLVSSLSKQGKGEQQTSSSRNLTLRVTSLESEERVVYVQWRGDFSHNSSPSLVLSPHLARDLRVGNHDLVQVESVSVGIVANVAVSAVRACDWTVICENVDTIESHLLQNIGVVFEDQLLHVSVPGIAMSVQLKVTAITLRDHGTRGGNGEGAPPASSSSSSNWMGRMFSLLTMEDSNTSANAVEKGVGKLVNSSLITVAPYVAPAPSSTHDDVVPLPVEPSLLDLSQQCVVDDICSHSEQLLKILPPFLRHTNSSYFANNIDEGREAFNSNILSQFGALPLKDDTSNEANISDDVDGLSTASAAIVLHPLFVYNVLKSYLVNENQVSFEGKLRQLESTLSQHFLIVLSPVPASTRQTANSLEPFTRSLVQTMRVSAGVRPGYVSAPYSALISLGLLPHEEASVRLIPLQRPTPLPLRVTLQPLSISLSVQGATCKEDDNEKHSLERFGLAMMAQMDSDDIIVISDGLIVPAAKPLCKESKVPAQSGEHLLLRLPGFSSRCLCTLLALLDLSYFYPPKS